MKRLPLSLEMGCLSFAYKKSKVEIIDETPKREDYDYLRPEGKIIYKIDLTYDVPKIEINFNGWYVNSVRLWPESKKARCHFLMWERTLPVSPQVSFSSSDSGVNDTAFSAVTKKIF